MVYGLMDISHSQILQVIVGPPLVTPVCGSRENIVSNDWFQVGSVLLVDNLHEKLPHAQISRSENPSGRYGSALLVAGFPLSNQRLVHSHRMSGAAETNWVSH